MFDRVFLGSSEAPSSALWRASPAKQRADDKERKNLMLLMSPRANPRNPGKDTNKERRLSSTNKDEPLTKSHKSGDFKGWINSKKKNMFVPKAVFGDDGKNICKAHARTDSQCPSGDKCFNSHDHFNDMPRVMQKKVIKWVDNDKKVNFVGIEESLLKNLRAEVVAEAGDNS